MTGRDIRARMEELDRAGYAAAKTVVTRLLEMDDRDRLLLRVRTEAAYGTEPARLRCLWTAWCLTVGAVPGSTEYEDAFRGLSEDSEETPDYDYTSAYVREAYGLA